MGGCVASKQAVSVTPAALDHSGALNSGGSGRGRTGGVLVDELESSLKKLKKRGSSNNSSCGGGSNYETGSEFGGSGRASSNTSFRLMGNVGRHAEGEAVHGWVPLKADSFEKLEKIGQGTYSTVFRARDLDTGKIVALKKVRFDNFEPESVRFMAREITILRRLEHPNIIKLEGLITSRSSSNIYLVFEYMEHDIAGLLSSPEITFTESQVKCYAKQLLSGLEHCHSRGVMHRDIKGANLLVDNQGILKVADFGLANFCAYSNNNHHRQPPLTSRVVTLWYRPPELLLGSTDYNASVDLWSVGCLLAELLTGKPILQGRTEVEQLHKIFKLCGSPPEDYWTKTKLPHATLFKPQQPYKSTLWETFQHLPESTVKVIETLLSIEPYKRGTATTTLNSEYFKTKPYACDPSSLPNYPPSKEIDIKHHEEASRKRPNGRSRAPETRKPTRKLNLVQPIQEEAKTNVNRVHNFKVDRALGHGLPKPTCHFGTKDTSHVKNASQGDETYTGPLQVSGSSGFAWAKARTNDTLSRSRNRSSSRSLVVEQTSETLQHSRNKLDSRGDDNCEAVKSSQCLDYAKGHGSFEMNNKRSMLRQWSQLERPDSFDASEYHSQELSMALYHKEEASAKKINLVYSDQGEKVEFSGPLLTQSRKIDELLEKHERHIRHAVRRSWFQRVKISGK